MGQNINDNAKSAKSQCDMIAAWLEQGRTITTLEAINRFGCIRLASRINDLRNRGMNIQTNKVKTNTGKIVAEYTLAK